MNNRRLTAFAVRGYAEAKAGEPIRFVASTAGVKRDGKDISQEDWLLDSYRANPICLWCHSYSGQVLPIGRAEVKVNGALIADVTFDQADDFARKVEGKYRHGYMNAVSVGWNDVKVGGRMKHELLDISCVPIPSDPDALMVRALRGWQLGAYGRAFDKLLDLEPVQDSREVEALRHILGHLDGALFRLTLSDLKRDIERLAQYGRE